MSNIEEMKAATYGAATQLSKAFADTIKAMTDCAIESAMDKMIKQYNNLNMGLLKKTGPEKSLDIEPKTIKPK